MDLQLSASYPLFSSPLINRRTSCRVRLHDYHSNPNLNLDESYSVYALSGRSEISRSFDYEIVFVSDDFIPIEALCDSLCTISLRDEINPLNSKTITGRIARASESGTMGRKHLYRLHVVHPLYYLGLNKRYEIYQDKSVPAIIATILKRYDILLGLGLTDKTDSARYPLRHYSTQYNQSDYEFITMLCEEEGLVLLDESENGNFQLTLCVLNDHAPFEEAIECTYNASKSFYPSSRTHDHYDPSKPSTDMSQTRLSKSAEAFIDNDRSVRLRRELRRDTFHERLDTYEGSLSKDLNRYTALDSERDYAKGFRIRGHSTSLALKEGIRTTLSDVKTFKRENVIILSVTYEGFFPNALDELIEHDHIEKEQYSVTFEAIPSSILYRPPYTITKPRIEGLHSAIVSKGDKETTAGANEIDVNELGEIRVIMHFDPNYPTTCYVPLNTLWSGERYGIRFIPRVNSEVLISYINGNIDRPVIVGTLHNGENAIPYDLPSTKTQSYIKTQTTPQYSDSEGYNEILFEDAQNNEQLNIRAQKDYNLLVLHDAREHIGHDRSERVDNDENVTIHGYRHERVNKSKTETIDIAKALTIGAGYQVSVGASKNETVGISSTEEVGLIRSTVVGEEYVMRVGESLIHMHANGQMEIVCNNFQIQATEYVEIKGKKVCFNGGCDKKEFPKSTLIKEETNYDEAFILSFEDGTVLSNHRYKLISSNGETLEGITDENGYTERMVTMDEADIQIILLGKA